MPINHIYTFVYGSRRNKVHVASIMGVEYIQYSILNTGYYVKAKIVKAYLCNNKNKGFRLRFEEGRRERPADVFNIIFRKDQTPLFT